MDDMKKAIEQGEKLLNYLGKFPCQCDHSVGRVCHACGNHEIVKNLIKAARSVDLNDRQQAVLNYYRNMTHPDLDAELTEAYVYDRVRLFGSLNPSPLGRLNFSITFKDGGVYESFLHRDDIGDSRVRIPLKIKTIGDYEAIIRIFGLDDSGISI